MTISYSLIENSLTDEPNQYRAIVQSTGTVELEDVINRMIERGSTITRADVLAVLQEYFAAVESLMLEGYKVNTPHINYGVSLKSNFYGQDDGFDASRHTVQASLNPGGQLRRAIRERAQVQKLEGIKPRPNPVVYTDVNSSERNTMLTPGGLGRLTGHRLKFDPADTRQGIFLNHLNNGNTPARVSIVGKNSPSELMFMIPANLPAGEYSLTVQTLFGQDDVRAGELGTVLNVPPN